MKALRSLVAGLLFCLGGCSDAAAPYLEVIRAQTAALGDLAQVLSTVTDQPSMAAAQSALRKRMAEFEAVKQRALALPAPTLAIRQQVAEEQPRIEAAIERLKEQVARVKSLPGGDDFLRGFDRGQGFLRDAS